MCVRIKILTSFCSNDEEKILIKGNVKASRYETNTKDFYRWLTEEGEYEKYGEMKFRKFADRK